jgi:hypothetical protein
VDYLDKVDLFRCLETLIILRNFLISFSCRILYRVMLEYDALGYEEVSLLTEVLIESSFSLFVQCLLFSIRFALKLSLTTKDWMKQLGFDFFILQSFQVRTDSFSNCW